MPTESKNTEITLPPNLQERFDILTGSARLGVRGRLREHLLRTFGLDPKEPLPPEQALKIEDYLDMLFKKFSAADLLLFLTMDQEKNPYR